MLGQYNHRYPTLYIHHVFSSLHLAMCTVTQEKQIGADNFICTQNCQVFYCSEEKGVRLYLFLPALGVNKAIFIVTKQEKLAVFQSVTDFGVVYLSIHEEDQSKQADCW